MFGPADSIADTGSAVPVAGVPTAVIVVPFDHTRIAALLGIEGAGVLTNNERLGADVLVRLRIEPPRSDQQIAQGLLGVDTVSGHGVSHADVRDDITVSGLHAFRTLHVLAERKPIVTHYGNPFHPKLCAPPRRRAAAA